jgi:large subunit ribosomal protein L15e
MENLRSPVIGMGMYKYNREVWKSPERDRKRELLIALRKQPVFSRIGKPTKLARARSLGYKAKQGVVLVRVRVPKGGRNRPKPARGRRPKRAGIKRFSPSKSRQSIAEERVQKKFPNLEVLNSYELIEDGKHKWFEVIMIEPTHPAILKDKDYNWIINQRKRVHRGLTSAGKKGRGLRHKGLGAEKVRGK